MNLESVLFVKLYKIMISVYLLFKSLSFSKLNLKNSQKNSVCFESNLKNKFYFLIKHSKIKGIISITLEGYPESYLNSLSLTSDDFSNNFGKFYSEHSLHYFHFILCTSLYKSSSLNIN